VISVQKEDIDRFENDIQIYINHNFYYFYFEKLEKFLIINVFEIHIVMFGNSLTFDPIKYEFNRCRDLRSPFLIQTRKMSSVTINCFKSPFVLSLKILTVGNSTFSYTYIYLK
jgi:hypothetical protein